VQELCYLVEESVGDTIGVINEDVTVHFAPISGNYEVGAFYHPYFDSIVVNLNPLRRVWERNPELVKDYLFYILLHEYIHSIGIYNEEKTRWLTRQVSRRVLGGNHPVTRLANGELSPFGRRLAGLKDLFVFTMGNEESFMFFSIDPDFLDA
jgi:hypothetical protein